MKTGRLLRSTAIAAASIATGTASSTALPLLVGMLGLDAAQRVYLLSGVPLAYLLFAALPDSAMDWIDPSGERGANIAVPVFLFSSWLSFAVLFAIATAFLLVRLAARRP